MHSLQNFGADEPMTNGVQLSLYLVITLAHIPSKGQLQRNGLKCGPDKNRPLQRSWASVAALLMARGRGCQYYQTQGAWLVRFYPIWV